MVSEFEVEELVRGMFGLGDDVDIDDYIYEHYDSQVSFEGFALIVRDLLPLIVVGQSPLTQKTYKGFGKDNMFFIKQEVD